MARPPKPAQRRYRGRILADMQAARLALKRLVAWDNKYRGKPCTSYPQQLATIEDVTVLVGAQGVLTRLVQSLGPVPIRPGCPTA